jgi:hypothetical protein
MRCHDYSLATLMEIFEEMHDLSSIGSIEIARWLISDDDARIVDERSGDTGSLYLST